MKFATKKDNRKSITFRQNRYVIALLNKWNAAVVMIIVKRAIGSTLSFMLACVVWFHVNVREESYNLLKMVNDWSQFAPGMFCRLKHFLQVLRYSLGGLR